MLRNLRREFLLGMAAFLILTGLACQPPTGPRPTVDFLSLTPLATQPTPTPRPTYTPTPLPLGDPANPIIIGFITAETTPEQNEAMHMISQVLADAVKMSVVSQVFTDFFTFERNLEQGRIHLVWLRPIEYIVASQRGALNLAMITNHLGITTYGVQVFANSDSGYTSYFDVSTDKSTTSAQTALAQFSGARPCLVDGNNLSGHWVPLGIFKQASILIQDPAYTNSSTASIRALYIKGVCDFAVTYALSGDPRTASAITTDLPDIMQKVIVIWRSEGIIPNLSLAFTNDLPLPLQVQIEQALMTFAGTPDGLETLSIANNYDIEALVEADDSIYDELRILLDIQEFNIRTLLRE